MATCVVPGAAAALAVTMAALPSGVQLDVLFVGYSMV